MIGNRQDRVAIEPPFFLPSYELANLLRNYE